MKERTETPATNTGASSRRLLRSRRGVVVTTLTLSGVLVTGLCVGLAEGGDRRIGHEVYGPFREGGPSDSPQRRGLRTAIATCWFEKRECVVNAIDESREGDLTLIAYVVEVNRGEPRLSISTVTNACQPPGADDCTWARHIREGTVLSVKTEGGRDLSDSTLADAARELELTVRWRVVQADGRKVSGTGAEEATRKEEL